MCQSCNIKQMPVTSNLLGKVVQNTIMSVTAVIRGCGPLLTVETFSTFLGSYDHEKLNIHVFYHVHGVTRNGTVTKIERSVIIINLEFRLLHLQNVIESSEILLVLLFVDCAEHPCSYLIPDHREHEI